MAAHVGIAVGGERHLSAPGTVDPDAVELRMDPDHGAVEQAPGPLDGRGRERGSTPEQDTGAVGRQAPIVQQVPGVEEHPSARAHRPGQGGVEGLGGDHVAPDGEDALPQPRDEPLIGGAVGRHHHLVGTAGVPRDVSTRNPAPRRSTASTGHARGAAAPGRGGGPGQTGHQLGRVETGAALDEQSAAETIGTDLGAEIAGRQVAGLFADSSVGVGHGRVGRRPAGMVRQLQMAGALPVELGAELR